MYAYNDVLYNNQVDPHIHVACCMSQKQLINFIKRKLAHHGDDVVLADGSTLKQVFGEMSLVAEDLTVDLLDARVVKYSLRFRKTF